MQEEPNQSYPLDNHVGIEEGTGQGVTFDEGAAVAAALVQQVSFTLQDRANIEECLNLMRATQAALENFDISAMMGPLLGALGLGGEEPAPSPVGAIMGSFLKRN